MLAVGDSTRLEIIFNTGSYKGTQTKSPVITTNEGPEVQSVVVVGKAESPKRTAKILANIFTNPDSTFPITIKPAKASFPDTGETVVTELYFSVVNRSKQTLTPRLVSFPRTLVSINLPKTIPASGYADLSIKLKDAALNKAFEKSVTFELNDTNHTRFTIPIKRGNPAPAKPAATGQTAH